ncbi:hypothetical protein NMY22_g1093 [Coprinellus aureogranulatus]|nr:hypothetical protein NMY22_g1093 [Coprinellus aureogranulatus]
MASEATSQKSVPSTAHAPNGSIVLWLKRLVIVGIIFAFGSYLDSIRERFYVFDPKSLHQLSQAAIAANPDNLPGMIDHIVANLTFTYPSTQVRLNYDNKEWVFNNAGGAMGAMYLIHASITEYLIIFGTPLGTEGHTGLLSADDYFNILIGEQWAFEPGALEMERYTPGTVHIMPRGVVKQYKMHTGCFALEYARGWIPGMMPFGFADAFTSTLDFPTLFRTVHITGREIIHNLLLGKL